MLGIVTTGEKGQGAAVQAPDFFYGYDSVGNRTFMDRSDEGKTEYSYDPSDQLTKASFPNGGFQEFAYDPAGNRLKLNEREDGQLHVTQYEYDAGNELVRLVRNFRESGAGPNALMAGPGAPTSATYFVTTFSFDGNGSRTSKAPDDMPATAYTWDAQERLLAVANGGRTVESAGYDAYFRRTKLVDGAVSMRLLYDGDENGNRYYEMADANGHGAVKRHIWLGSSAVAVLSPGETIYFAEDAVGSAAAKVGPTGIVLQRDFYKPYGEVRSVMASLPTLNSSGYVHEYGVQYDSGIGLSHMWFRYYDAGLGIFLSTDPVGRKRGKYKYVQNNPQRYTDELGLDECISKAAREILEGKVMGCWAKAAPFGDTDCGHCLRFEQGSCALKFLVNTIPFDVCMEGARTNATSCSGKIP